MRRTHSIIRKRHCVIVLRHFVEALKITGRAPMRSLELPAKMRHLLVSQGNRHVFGAASDGYHPKRELLSLLIEPLLRRLIKRHSKNPLELAHGNA